MSFKEVHISSSEALELERFKEMDYYAVEQYELPIELMMENAGLQLANLVVYALSDISSKILIGVGNGNNGGGGLVAARRLAAWGYDVHLDVMTEITRELPKRQLERARLFGVKNEAVTNPDVWVDAYLGFSQRLPLRENLRKRIDLINELDCKKISLDIPTGFLGDVSKPHFKADQVLSLAAPKKIHYNLPSSCELFVADLGIPMSVYRKFGTEIPPFDNRNILKIDR